MDAAKFSKLFDDREGAYHLVDDQGRYIIRKETGKRVFGTLIDYNCFLVFFEGPDVREENVLKKALTKSNWLSRGNNLATCNCGIEECEGKLPIALFEREVGPGWTLEIEAE